MTQIIKKIINKKKVYIVEEHHHVLLPWASEREQLGIAPHVLTLDHHTDTLPEYTHYDETHETPHEKRIDRRDPRQIEAALKDLRHDEHFDFAIRNDIISCNDLLPRELLTGCQSPDHDHSRSASR